MKTEAKSKEIPPFVANFGSEEPEKPKPVNFTPDDLKTGKLAKKLPRPTGYRLLILPFALSQKTKGGIYLARQTVERERLTTVVGYIVALGPDAYKDPVKLNTEGGGKLKAVKGKAKGGGAATKGLSFIQWIKE